MLTVVKVYPVPVSSAGVSFAGPLGTALDPAPVFQISVPWVLVHRESLGCHLHATVLEIMNSYRKRGRDIRDIIVISIKSVSNTDFLEMLTEEGEQYGTLAVVGTQIYT